jgi:hypothetical protein
MEIDDLLNNPNYEVICMIKDYPENTQFKDIGDRIIVFNVQWNRIVDPPEGYYHKDRCSITGSKILNWNVAKDYQLPIDAECIVIGHIHEPINIRLPKGVDNTHFYDLLIYYPKIGYKFMTKSEFVKLK